MVYYADECRVRKDDSHDVLATLVLGLAFFGLFYALVVACDHPERRSLA